MARYLRHQDEIKCFIDKNDNLVIKQTDSIDGSEWKIYVNHQNVLNFIQAIQETVQEARQEDDNEMV